MCYRVGYFMHIPFPPWDMIKIHPWKDIFLQGILGSDLIGGDFLREPKSIQFLCHKLAFTNQLNMSR